MTTATIGIIEAAQTWRPGRIAIIDAYESGQSVLSAMGLPRVEFLAARAALRVALLQAWRESRYRNRSTADAKRGAA